jgi:hypothetical protein
MLRGDDAINMEEARVRQRRVYEEPPKPIPMPLATYVPVWLERTKRWIRQHPDVWVPIKTVAGVCALLMFMIWILTSPTIIDVPTETKVELLPREEPREQIHRLRFNNNTEPKPTNVIEEEQSDDESMKFCAQLFAAYGGNVTCGAIDQSAKAVCFNSTDAAVPRYMKDPNIYGTSAGSTGFGTVKLKECKGAQSRMFIGSKYFYVVYRDWHNVVRKVTLKDRLCEYFMIDSFMHGHDVCHNTIQY